MLDVVLTLSIMRYMKKNLITNINQYKHTYILLQSEYWEVGNRYTWKRLASQCQRCIKLCMQEQSENMTMKTASPSHHGIIDLLHKLHNLPLLCPIMHHFVTEMCAHFCYKMMHYGIFVQCIMGFVRWSIKTVIERKPCIILHLTYIGSLTKSSGKIVFQKAFVKKNKWKNRKGFICD